MTDEKLNGIIKALKLCTGSETACKDCPYRASVSPSFFVRCEDTLHEASLEAIEALKAENAALKERLDKAVELPVKVGDIVYCVEDEDGDYIVEPTVVTKKNIYLLCSRIKGNPSNAFLLQKAAEEWCKELKGEKE